MRVLSSLDLRIVAPRVAAREAATRVKSRPVRARRTSIVRGWLFEGVEVWKGGVDT